MTESHVFASPLEAVRMLNLVHGAGAITPRQVRYLAQQGIVRPDHVPAIPGASAFYELPGLTLLDLYVRLTAAGVTSWRVRAFLLYAGGEIWERARFGGALPVVVFQTFGSAGVLVTEAEARRMKAPAVVVQLSRTVADLERAYLRLRRECPVVWTGAGWAPAREVARFVVEDAASPVPAR